MISIILSCFNGAQYLSEAIQSVLDQSFKDWELIFVNDGSTDDSLLIALKFKEQDRRITVVSKENGGYVSARLYGLKFSSSFSEYLHFFDADDVLHPEMLQKLVDLIDLNPNAGAVYCNHSLIDEFGNDLGLPSYGVRLVPTYFWMRFISEDDYDTPFISIFCWASKMIEPMTLIRRTAYNSSNGWDVRFGKGKGNIGDGTLLFSEIALSWKILYIKEPLYFYRKHQNQATSSAILNRNAGEKVIEIWKERISGKYKYSRDIKGSIICHKHRQYAFSKSKSLKYALRYNFPFFLYLLIAIPIHWLISLKLLFYKNTKVFQH